MEESEGFFNKVLIVVSSIFFIILIIGLFIVLLLGLTYVGLEIYNEILLLI